MSAETRARSGLWGVPASGSVETRAGRSWIRPGQTAGLGLRAVRRPVTALESTACRQPIPGGEGFRRRSVRSAVPLDCAYGNAAGFWVLRRPNVSGKLTVVLMIRVTALVRATGAKRSCWE
jgi:hypothetical protein